MMRRIVTMLALAALAAIGIAPATTAATPPDDAMGRSWEVAATRYHIDRSTGTNVWTGALAFLNVDDGSVRESPWGDYVPDEVAYSPDARTLYTTGNDESLSGENDLLITAHDASSGDVLWSATVSSYAGLAVSPDGSVAMTASDKIDLTTHEVVSFDPCADTRDDLPLDVAFSPDGSTAWILCRFSENDPSQLRAYDPATLDLLHTIQLPHDLTGGIAITPDGSTAMLSGARVWPLNSLPSDRALRVDLATGAVVEIVATDSFMFGSISTSPDGIRAYFGVYPWSDDSQGSLWGVDIATMTLAASSPLESFGAQPIVTPDGAKVFAIGSGPWGQAGEPAYGISAHDAATLAPLDATPLPGINRLAVTPDQAPVARLTASEPNSPVTFDASTSTVEFGTIAEYAWDFGDGATLVTTTPTVEHEYAEPGQYTATVRLTSSGGTSTEDVYTGHQLLRNGDPSAIASVVVTVPATAPDDGLPDELPPTGSDSTWLAAAAAGMLMAGATAVVIARRRVQH